MVTFIATGVTNFLLTICDMIVLRVCVCVGIIINIGFGAELCATLQTECFYSLQVPIARVCGYDIPFPLVHEKYYIPDTFKIYDAILNCVEQAK